MESRLARIEEKLDGLGGRLGRIEHQLWGLVAILLAGFIGVIATLLAAD